MHYAYHSISFTIETFSPARFDYDIIGHKMADLVLTEAYHSLSPDAFWTFFGLQC